MSREVRIAPNIYQTPHGWRVYVRRQGTLKAVRFKPSVTLEDLQHFRDAFKLESKRLRRAHARASAQPPATTFADDAKAYLQLATTRAMPSVKERRREIQRWVTAFGNRPRHTITARQIDEQLQALRDEKYSASSVNKFRTALMSLWTRLDGRSAANPVRDTTIFEEAEQFPRGQPYALLTRILKAIPPERGRGVKGKKGSRARGSLSRVRLELLAWTGMDPAQIKRLLPAHFSIRERWYMSPRRAKGSRRARMPRPTVKKPMSLEAAKAFERFVALKCGGDFSTHSLRHTWLRACRRVERDIQRERKDPAYRLPHIRLKDLRHSFGTELFRRTKNLDFVGEMLDHASRTTTRRYALGAVSDLMRGYMRKFDAATIRPARKRA